MSSKADGFGELIDRYLAGESTREEHERITQLLGQRPDALDRLASLSAKLKVWQDRLPVAPTPSAQILEAVLARETGTQLPPSDLEHTAKKVGSIRGSLSVPRGFGRGSVWQGLRLGTHSLRGRRVLTRSVAFVLGVVAVGMTYVVWDHGSVAPNRGRVYRTAAGHYAQVVLPNRTRLTLAPATVVEAIAEDRIRVQGEVNVVVPTRPSTPFHVETRRAVVHVLGTVFDVREYPTDRMSRIVVENGKVMLQPMMRHLMRSNASNTGHFIRREPSRPATVLTAQMLAQVTDSGVTVTPGIATRDYIGWTQGLLVFNRVPLRDVVTELGRAYGVTIRIADSVLAAKTLVAEIEVRQKTLTQVLDVISTAMCAHYVRAGREFIVAPGVSVHQGVDTERQRTRFPQPERIYGR